MAARFEDARGLIGGLYVVGRPEGTLLTSAVLVARSCSSTAAMMASDSLNRNMWPSARNSSNTLIRVANGIV